MLDRVAGLAAGLGGGVTDFAAGFGGGMTDFAARFRGGVADGATGFGARVSDLATLRLVSATAWPVVLAPADAVWPTDSAAAAGLLRPASTSRNAANETRIVMKGRRGRRKV